jgi:hypothetical protein
MWQLAGEEERQAHCEVKGANAMTETPTGGAPGLAAGDSQVTCNYCQSSATTG